MIELNQNFRSFQPPRRTLMGPGPSDISPRTLNALGLPVVGHLDPSFAAMMDEIKVLLRYAFQTRNALTFPVSAPGSLGMETCFVNLVEPGDTVIVCRNGVFGGRMIENVERCGAKAIVVDDAWGTVPDPQKVEDAFRANPEASLLAFVHAETSTGCAADAAALAEIARRHEALTIVDAVTSLGGSELRVDDWGLDAVYSGSQKCLSCTPGLSPVTFSEAALARVKARKTKVQSWFMDLNLVLQYWGETARTYHHTAPISALYGLHESLLQLAEEGLEQSWQRHLHQHAALRAGLETLGLEFIVAAGNRLPQLNSVRIPEGVADAEVRKLLLAEFGLEIGAGLGPLAGKIWRIGLMGYSARRDNVTLCIRALAAALAAQGKAVDVNAALAAVDAAYARQTA